MNKLEDNKLWKDSSAVSEEAYELLDEFPEEEKWSMASRLRSKAFDLTAEIAESIGSTDPRDKIHYLGYARRAIFSIKNVYLMGKRNGIFVVEPNTILRIDNITEEIDREIAKSAKDIPTYLDKFEVRKKK